MKDFHNIEKSAFPQRQYVGYSADGRSWRITGRSGYWTATANLTRQGSINLIMGVDRIAHISNQFAGIKGNES